MVSVVPLLEWRSAPPALPFSVAIAVSFAHVQRDKSIPYASVTTSGGARHQESHWRNHVVSLPEPSTTESQPPVAQASIALVTAPPGTGKTHAAMVALVEHGTRALYVTPTHELAMQIQDDLNVKGVTTHYWRQGPDGTKSHDLPSDGQNRNAFGQSK